MARNEPPVTMCDSCDKIATQVCSNVSTMGKDARRRLPLSETVLSGGLCFEGLNNAGHLKKDLLVVLNTNEMMSISPRR